MFRKMAAIVGALLAAAVSSRAVAQQYYQAPAVTNLTGGGIAPANQAVGGGTSQPPESGYGEGYTIPTGGGTAASSEGVGGGISDSPYSSYGSGYAAGITGGGLNAVTQGSNSNAAAAIAPNGETYKALGISGY